MIRPSVRCRRLSRSTWRCAQSASHGIGCVEISWRCRFGHRCPCRDPSFGRKCRQSEQGTCFVIRAGQYATKLTLNISYLNETSLILLLSLRPALIFKELCTLEHYHKSRRPFFILDRDPSWHQSSTRNLRVFSCFWVLVTLKSTLVTYFSVLRYPKMKNFQYSVPLVYKFFSTWCW